MSVDSEYYGLGPGGCQVIQIAVIAYPNDEVPEDGPAMSPGPGHRLYALCEDGSIWYNDMAEEGEGGWYWRSVPSPQTRREEQDEDNIK